MSAWLMPICGRESGSTLSTLTTSAGLLASAGSGIGCPVSGHVGGGGGTVVVVVGAVVVVVVVAAGASSDDVRLTPITVPAISTTTAATEAMTRPRVVDSSARSRSNTPLDGGVPSPQPVLATPGACRGPLGGATRRTTVRGHAAANATIRAGGRARRDRRPRARAPPVAVCPGTAGGGALTLRRGPTDRLCHHS